MRGPTLCLALMLTPLAGCGGDVSADRTIAAAVELRDAPPPSPPEAAAAQSAAVDKARDGLFYVHAHINGRKLRMMVDTGASVTVLTAADARLVGAAPAAAHFNRSVETVGGSTAMAWTTLDRVELAGHDVRNVRAAVVREGLGVSLLGQNMLAEFHSVTITSGRLSLR